MKIRISLFVIASVFCLSLPTAVAPVSENTAFPKQKVRLRIEASGPYLDQLEGYMTMELKDFPDVVISDANIVDWLIDVVATPTINSCGKREFAVSCVIVRCRKPAVGFAIDGRLGVGVIHERTVYVDDETQLKAISKKIAVDYEDCLSGARTTHRMFQN